MPTQESQESPSRNPQSEETQHGEELAEDLAESIESETEEADSSTESASVDTTGESTVVTPAVTAAEVAPVTSGVSLSRTADLPAEFWGMSPAEIRAMQLERGIQVGDGVTDIFTPDDPAPQPEHGAAQPAEAEIQPEAWSPEDINKGEIEYGGHIYHPGDEVEYIWEKKDGTQETHRYVVLSGMLDNDGIVIQLNDDGKEGWMVHHLGNGKGTQEKLKPLDTSVDVSDRNQFMFKGEMYKPGDKILYTGKESGKTEEYVVVTASKNGEGMVVQKIGREGDPTDDHVFRLSTDGEVVKIPPPGPPPGPPNPEDPLTLGVVDWSHSKEQMAGQLAGDRLMAEKAQLDAERLAFLQRHENLGKTMLGRGLLNVISTCRHPYESIFRQNILKNTYLNKYKYEYLTGDKRGDIDLTELTEESAMRRLTMGQEARENGRAQDADTLLHGDEILAQEDPEVVAFKQRSSELIKERVLGRMSQDDYEEAKKQLIAEAPWIRERHAKNGESVVDALDTFDQAVERLMAVYDHTHSMEEIDRQLANMRMVTGETYLGARAEIKMSMSDRIIDKLTRSKVGYLVPDQAVAVAVAAAGAIAMRGSSSVASKVMFGTGVLISGAGVYSRERLALSQERTYAERQRAASDSLPSDDVEHTPVRREISDSLLEMMSASDVLTEVQALRSASMPDGSNRQMTPELAAAMLDTVVRVGSSLRWGDANQRDVMRYTSAETMESQRLELDMSIIELRQMTAEYYRQHPDQMPAGFTSFDQLLESRSRLFIEEQLSGTVEALDKQFNAYAKNRAFKKAALTVGFGLAGAAAAKFGGEMLMDRMGVGGTKEVIPGRIRTLPNEQKAPFGVDFQAPKPWKLEASPGGNGTSLVDTRTGQSVMDNIQFNEKGGMAQASIDALRAKGIKIHTQDYTISGPPQEVRIPNDVVNQNWQRINRSWMDNDTPKPLFDRNELRFDIRQEGNDIVLDASRMRVNGSFHAGHIVNAQSEIAAGRMRILMSTDQYHQGTPFQLNVDPATGTVRIPVDSVPGKNFFDMSSGQPRFKGWVIEAGATKGINPDGREALDILASDRGEGIPDVVFDVPSTKTLTQTILTATERGPGRVVDIPPVLPFIYVPFNARFGLENRVPREQDRVRTPEVPAWQPPVDRPPTGPGSQPPVDRPPAGPGSQPPVEQPPTGVGNQQPGMPPYQPPVEGPPAVGPGEGPRIALPGSPPQVALPGSPQFAGEIPQVTGRRAIASGEQPIGELPPGTPAEIVAAIEAGEQTLAELPIRAESIIRIPSSVAALEVVQRSLAIGQTDARVVIPDFDALQTRLRQGRYSLDDLRALQAALDVADREAQANATPESFQLQRDIISARDWFKSLEAKYDDTQFTQLNLLYDIVDDVRKLTALGYQFDNIRQVNGRLGNMIQRIRAGRQLTVEEYAWLEEMSELSYGIVVEAKEVEREVVEAKAHDDRGVAVAREDYAAAIDRQRDLLQARRRALSRFSIEARAATTGTA